MVSASKKVSHFIFLFAFIIQSFPVSASSSGSSQLPSGEVVVEAKIHYTINYESEFLFYQFNKSFYEDGLKNKELIKVIRKTFKNKGIPLNKENLKIVLEASETLKKSGEAGETPQKFVELKLKKRTVKVDLSSYLQEIYSHESDHQVRLLKKLLAEADMPISDKATLGRIIKRFRTALLTQNADATPSKFLESSEGKNLRGHRQLQDRMYQFLDAVYKTYYKVKITSGERKALKYLDDIFRGEGIAKREIVLFRRMLGSMGLPANIHNDEFIRTYLLSKLHAEKMQEGTTRFGAINDSKAIEIVRESALLFDNLHLSGLKNQTKILNTIKGFPAQFILFQAAIGFTIYREHFTDPLVYDAQRNPEPLETLMQSLSPSAVVSFFIFIVVMQSTNYNLYKWGHKWNSKTLRSIAPHVGLGTGFFASMVFDEILHDMELRECAKAMMKGGEEEGYYISPCEASYLKWVKNSKWKEYGLDIVAILFSSWFSHKILTGIMFALRASAKGTAVLTQLIKRVGFRVTGWFGFFATLATFMEVHKVLDKYFVQPTKARVVVRGLQELILNLKSDVGQFAQIQSQFGQTDNAKEGRMELMESAKNIGHQFTSWPRIKGMHYEQAFYSWKMRTDKTTVTYEAMEKLLSGFYRKSRRADSFREEKEKKIESLIAKTNAFLENATPEKVEIIKDSLNENIDFVNYEFSQILTESIDFFKMSPEAFEKNKSFYFKNICPYLKEQGIRSQIEEFAGGEEAGWVEFCNSEDGDVSLNLVNLLYELSPILKSILSQTKNGLKSSENELSSSKVTQYVSDVPNELFSNKLSLYTMSAGEQLQLATYFLSAPELSTPLPYSDKAVLEMEKWICVIRGQDEDQSMLEECLQDESTKALATLRLTDKAFASGVYILKNLVKEMAFEANYRMASSDFSNLSGLLEFVDIYRKGEDVFVEQAEFSITGSEEDRPFEEETLYPYIKNFICGSEEGEISKDGQFQAPQLFPEISGLCDHLNNEAFAQKFSARERYFHIPVKNNGKVYPSVYLAIEDQIRKKFNSEEELLKFFQQKIDSTVRSNTEGILTSLQNITKNYIGPGLLNTHEDILDKTKCLDIQEHYIVERMPNFKGLEIQLFQVKFWMDQIRKSAQSVEHVENFNLDNFNAVACQVLERLKNYHDTYAKGKSLSELYPEEAAQFVKESYEGEDSLSAIKKAYGDLPVFVPQELMLSAIAEVSYSEKNSKIALQLLVNNFFDSTEENVFSFALFVELNRSLSSFYQYLELLRMKERVEKVIHKK